MLSSIVTCTSLLSVAIPLVLLAVSIIAIIRSKTYASPILSPNYSPHCSIILPCKGTPTGLRENIQSFLDLDYPSYNLYITVESEDDTAVPIIRDVIRNNARAKLIIAGITHTCGQKNHNLIEAVKRIDSTDILIFADADISLSPTWIQQMIAPLQDNAITVTTGFRWLVPATASLGSLGHSYQNFILYLFFSFSSWVLNTGVWGGSMALRKKDYLDLEIEEVWSRTSVDDMSLSETLKKRKVKTELVYTAVTRTEDTITSIHPMMKWFERQVMYLKAHQKPEWYATIALATGGGIMYLLLLLGGISFFYKIPNGPSLLQTALQFFILLSSVSIAAGVIAPMRYFGRFILMTPLSFLFALLAVLKTLFTNTIIWSGVSYTIRFKDGRVINVERGPQ